MKHCYTIINKCLKLVNTLTLKHKQQIILKSKTETKNNKNSQVISENCCGFTWIQLPLTAPAHRSYLHPAPRPASNQFSRSVMPDSLWPHEPQHARPPCPSPTPGVHPSPCPLSRWWHPTISSSVIPFSSCPQSFPASGSFQNESALRIRWLKYWSFSFNISPFNEHPGLISFRMD